MTCGRLSEMGSGCGEGDASTPSPSDCVPSPHVRLRSPLLTPRQEDGQIGCGWAGCAPVLAGCCGVVVRERALLGGVRACSCVLWVGSAAGSCTRCGNLQDDAASARVAVPVAAVHGLCRGQPETLGPSTVGRGRWLVRVLRLCCDARSVGCAVMTPKSNVVSMLRMCLRLDTGVHPVVVANVVNVTAVRSLQS